MKSSVIKRSVVLAGHKTSVSLEDEFWRGLKEIAGGIDRIIPGHDPKVRDLYRSYDFDGVKLTALHEVPKPHDVAELTRLPSAA